jgi:hypothetical protein
MNGGTYTPMPRYQCHKKVWALKIKAVIPDPLGDGAIIEFVDPVFSDRRFHAADLEGRPTPSSGMYMVQYEDGYISFSPAKTFEEGYTRI